ncbi:MAG: PKD domain-containing protein [Chloroflexi bacterium]|nr:PKD domain-containing protein [Chloroflexota bacterium]
MPVNFSGTATDPGTADILTYAWDFDNDGSFADATGATGTYLYPSLDGPTEKIVTLRVNDDDYPFPTTNGGEIGEAFDTLKLTIKNLPPWNVSAGGPYNGVETQAINLTATAEDAPADVPTLKYDWDLDSNPDFETPGKQVTQIWNVAGNYTIRLRVRDKDGGESFGSAQVTITNAFPNAEANGPYTSTVNLPVTLSSAGSSDPTNDPLTYQWNFGDGVSLVVTNSITATHSYTDDRVYTATLQVDDGRGGTDTDMAIVTINNSPPTAVANANPNPAAKGAPVTFNGSGSTDPDDNPAGLTYQWNFGDGNTANGINVNHTYANQNTYTAVLTVIDDNGATDTASIVITVNNTPPVAVAGPDQTVNEGGQLTFNGSGSSDPNPGDTLSYQWNFGDGSPVGNGVSVTHPYPDGPATYIVTLTVTDADGGSATDTLQVTVNNVAPTAAAGSDQTVDEGSQVNFNGSGSSDPGLDNLSYQWDFGDGSPVANGVNVAHTYPDGPASYVVTLTVTDSDGSVGTDTAQITVNNVAPTAQAVADQTTVTVGQVVNFDGSGSTDPGADTLTYLWDFGDGTTDNSGPIVSHAWTITGTYTIILQVDDGQGGSGATSITVQVN